MIFAFGECFISLEFVLACFVYMRNCQSPSGFIEFRFFSVKNHIDVVGVSTDFWFLILLEGHPQYSGIQASIAVEKAIADIQKDTPYWYYFRGIHCRRHFLWNVCGATIHWYRILFTGLVLPWEFLVYRPLLLVSSR